MVVVIFNAADGIYARDEMIGPGRIIWIIFSSGDQQKA